MPHCDAAASRAARCPDQHHLTTRQDVYGHQTLFAIVCTGVGNGMADASKNQFCLGEIQPTLRKRFGLFCWIELDVYAICCAPKEFNLKGC